MRRLFFVGLLVITSCGATQDSSPLAPPSPPTAALAQWSDFPANANPRPIVAFSDVVEQIGPGEFPDNDSKLTWICNKFVLAGDVQLTSAGSLDATVTWPSGATGSYRSIGSARALSALMARPAGGNSTDCARVKPFVITNARWATAQFPTDRGKVTMSAWLFDVPAAKGFLAHSGLDPSAYWGGVVMQGGEVGGRISSDGLTLTIGLVGGPDTPGPCGEDYAAAAAESDSAVAVAISWRIHGGAGATCTLEGHFRSVTVHLAKPLGGRVVIDAKGNVGGVCPETGDC
jgi:hypothetical protein